MQLTDTYIKSIKPLEKPKKYFDGGGLFLYVPPTGNKFWRLSYRFDKKAKLLSLGEYPTVSLKEARARREEAKKLLAKDIDPSEHKKAIKSERIAEAQNSFKNIALEWHETRMTEFSSKHRSSTLSRLNKYLFPAFGKKAITKIEAQDILAVVRPIEQANMVKTAQILVQMTGQIFRFAIATGRAKHNIAADLKGALRTHKTVHRASITNPQRLKKLLNDIDSFKGYVPLMCALKLAPLVFVRPSELRCATWDEFDFEKKEWRIKAERMKMKQLHIVPLSSQALEILHELREATGNGTYLFPSPKSDTRPMHDETMIHALRKMGYPKEEMSVHGFRSIASTLLNELGYNRDWIERQLAHGERDDVRAAYNYAQYLPERRHMMQEWTDYLTALCDNTN